jgi:hypothetical protein
MKIFFATAVNRQQQQMLNRCHVRRRLYSYWYLRAPGILRKMEAAKQFGAAAKVADRS